MVRLFVSYKTRAGTSVPARVGGGGNESGNRRAEFSRIRAAELMLRP